MKVAIEEGCIGCGMCENTCPSVFRLDENGLAEVYSAPKSEDENAVEEAAENCPVSVIIVE